ncbi:Eukaryotic translation initiation factor 4G [Euphorbia peplus]|nr:Eukaryotic translation initiation factor 4G [Euphorbia peplus]
MSFNQSRTDKSETQYRKSGRSAGSNQQRSSSGAFGKGGGGGPALSPSSSSSLGSSNRSFKKNNNNAQGGQQSRVNVQQQAVNSSDPAAAAANASAHPRHLQNGAHSQHGASDAPVSVGTGKPIETPNTQRSTRPVPKAPTSQSASVSSENASPVTPTKSPGDASKASFPFQFGSISPGFMNGMQIPARTSSAPPNLDEQKRDQARNDNFRTGPPLPIPAPKQQIPRKDMGAVDQSNAGEAYPVPKAKKDIQVSAALPLSQTQKAPVLPIPMTSMQMPFHQSPVPVQFGGPNSQIQPQGVPPSSHQMPMSMTGLPMGTGPQMQQPMFVPGLQPHPMQPQGIIHQGQGLAFAPQMGPQMPPQLGNLGIGMSPQYPQQQGGKFGGQRKTTVKITDPKTHEELRLDKRTDKHPDSGSTGLRSHPNMPPQSQPMPSYAPTHPINYYPNSYNPNNLFFQPSGSLPLNSGQVAPNSQQPRFNYSASQGLHNASIANPPAANSLPHKSGVSMHVMAEPTNVEQMRDPHNVISSGTVQVKVKPATSSGEKVVDLPSSNSSSTVEKGLSSKLSRLSVESNLSPVQKDSENILQSTSHHSQPGTDSLVPKSVASGQSVPADNTPSNSTFPVHVHSENSAPVGSGPEVGRKESLSRSNSIKDHQKKPAKKGYVQSHQIGGQSTSVSSVPSRTQEQGISSSNIAISDSMDIKTTPIPSLVTESVPTIGISTSDVSGANVNDSGDSSVGVRSEIASPRGVIGSFQPKDDGMKLEDKNSEIPIESIASKSVDHINQSEKESVLVDEVRTLETQKERADEPVTSHTENAKLPDNVEASISRDLESADTEKSHVDDISVSDASSRKSDIMENEEASVTKSSPSEEQSAPVSDLVHSEASSKHEGDAVDNSGGALGSIAGSKDKPAELTRTKSTTGKVKKKRKEILQKADAAGTTSDLYMAYKGPEEKKDGAGSSEVTESNSAISKETAADASVASEKAVPSKFEPDDWEDAADISTPKLETSEVEHGKDGNTDTAKRYSRDFLLKFSEQCTDLPGSFEITSDIADALMTVNVSQFVERESFPSPGRVMDRSNSARMDRRGSNVADNDRWSKLPGPFPMGRGDLHVDVALGGNLGFRPGQGGNFGVLRNPRTQQPMQYAGGILSGPMQGMGSHGGMQRNSPDAERWQRATNFQKGLIPSPQTPMQIMHKAERKYEVGKITDEEQAKQRQLKGVLNKLTPQNFEKLFEQVKAVNIDNAVTLTGVISQIFDKALMEPTFCEMYANFCYHLANELPDFTENNERITFKRLLLNKCQEEFERGEREQEEANKADEEGETKQTPEEREEKRTNARRRMLGNIRLIGELYKKRMLTERIMHECIKKLLGQYQNPDEEDVEALCKLMSTIGEMIDHPKAKEHMDAYFDRMFKLSNNMKLSSRVRFMLKDAIDLRRNKWQQRRKVEGPKKIDEVHRDAAQERHHQSSRLSRNPTMNPSPRRAPMDFGPRGSGMVFSPNPQMGGFHGLPAQGRGFGNQDVRFEERQSYEARTLSVPLPRTLGDDSITLGPQGGLARGMSRGPPAMATTSIPEFSHNAADSRRMAPGLNGFSSAAERQAYNPREDFVPRDPRAQDRSFERPLATSPPGQAQPPTLAQNNPSEKVSEDQLREMSLAAIKEYYSARDEGEVALCIKDLNSSSFHPSMISLWVTDSFERKDMERDLLTKLLVNLARSQESTLTSPQLIQGFEMVLTTLEDTVTDAPKAPEFLGRMFGKAVVDNVVALGDIGQLLYTGGDEPGRLLEIGLAGDVLGNTLEMIRSEKGESILNEIKNSSNLNVEDFRPPEPNRSRILENFIR